MRRNVRANSPWCGSRRGALCWRGVPPRRPAHLFVGLGCEAGALDAQRDDVLLAQLHLRRVQASRSAERSHCGKARRGRVGQGGGRGARRRRVQLAGGSVNGSIMSFLMQSLMHCVDTTMPAGVKRAGSLQWPRKATRRGEPDSGPSCGGGKRAEKSLLLCSLRHRRAAAPPPDAHWRVAACSAGTCTCAVRGRSASDRRCCGSGAWLQSRVVGRGEAITARACPLQPGRANPWTRRAG